MVDDNDPHCRTADQESRSCPGLPLRLEHPSLQGRLVPCQIVNRAIRARLQANGLTVSTKWQPGLAFLLTPRSKDVLKNIALFFLLHVVHLVGTGKAIHLMNALITIINIHIITGQFSPAIIHHALCYRTALSRVSITLLNFIPCCHQEMVSTELQMARMERGKGDKISLCSQLLN